MSELRDLFELARELPTAGREAALRARTADENLIAEVLALLDAAGATQTRGRAPVRALLAQFNATELQAGDTLGAWRLLHELGHGGMGAVYLAERADGHFRQQAAIKLIRGLADEETAARFARERQLLADLQHPQIARLLDGGATPSGAPYLIMEYVEGVSLDAWAVDKRLDERLRILVSICKTLQFAHQRLIVHCDLKPSNVLVRADGSPVLLDFGIARALDRAEANVAHDYAMTPRYASPEQVSGEKATIASDVYSLGLLLYRLVADAAPAPFDKDRPAAPPAPSTSPVSWRARLRGDIDAIVAHACTLDPTQRYPSAQALAEDIERIAAHKPVSARKPTFAYIAARVLRRFWPAFAVGAFVLALAVGFTWRTVQAERRAVEQALVAERATDFLVSTFALSDPTQSERHDFTAREVLDRGAARIGTELTDEPRVRARLLEALGNAYRGINERDAGRPLLDRAAALYLDPVVDEPTAAARSLSEEAQSILASGQSSIESENVARRAVDLTQRYDGKNWQQLADALEALAWTLQSERRMPEALATERQALDLLERNGAGAEKIAPVSTRLCRILLNTGAGEQALPHCERAVVLLRGARGGHNPFLPAALLDYGNAQFAVRNFAGAVATVGESGNVAGATFGEDSLELARHRERVAATLGNAGQFAEAEALLGQSTPVIARRNGMQSAQYARALGIAGWVKYQRGEFAAAVDLLRRAAQINDADPAGEYNNGRQVLHSRLGQALVESGDTGTDTRKLLDDVTTERSAAGADAYELAYTRLPLARLYTANRDYATAEKLLDEVEAVPDATDFHADAAHARAAIAHGRGDDAGELREDERAWRLTLDEIGADNPYTARYALLFARDLRRAGRRDEAEALEKQYRTAFEKAFPTDSAFRREQ